MVRFRYFCYAVIYLLILGFSAQSEAWYSSPGTGQYFPSYNPYSAGMSPWQGAVMPPGRGAFGYNGPWGNMNGGINPDGSFWVNIRFGGSYQDLQALIAVMQMSGAMQIK